MTPEAQRTAIAKSRKLKLDRPRTGWHDLGCDCQECYPIPNYLGSHDAMMKAWRAMVSGPPISVEVSNDRIALRELAKVVAPKYAPDWPDCGSYPIKAVLALVKATPAQYAEAYLRTLNLWTDDHDARPH